MGALPLRRPEALARAGVRCVRFLPSNEQLRARDQPRRSQHRRLFPTVDDVYRIKRNVLERLRRNRRLQLLFKHQHL